MAILSPENIPQFKNDPESAIKFYLEHGYHVELNVLNDEECSDLIEQANNFEGHKNKTFCPQMMPHRINETFLTALKNKRVVDIISKMVGGKVSGLQSEFFFGKPSVRGFSLHQDNFYVEAADEVFASAWCALTDVTEKKGSLIVYPGTHKLGKLPVRKLNMERDISQDPNANDQETIVPEGYEPFNAIVPKGAVLFIHGNLVHGSNRNETDEFRYVLLNTYIKKGEKFRAGNFAKRQEIDLYNDYHETEVTKVANL